MTGSNDESNSFSGQSDFGINTQDRGQSMETGMRYLPNRLLYLSTAAALCGGFWGWAFVQTVIIDSYMADSRVGFALIPCSVALAMTLIFQVRIVKVVRYMGFKRLGLQPFRAVVLVVLNLVSIGSLVGTTLVSPFIWLSLFYATALFLPGMLIGVGVATLTSKKDLPNRDERSTDEALSRNRGGTFR